MAHRNKYIIEAFILGLFDENNVWCGMPARVVYIDDEAIQIDDYASEYGFTLPDA
jgi:hypothetical protein